ncbi:MAG: MetQ/NlpA family ABC transporter substrate-binding protein [Acidobacteria bacterium]|nr:MetQ/NlpA family ABC transporter substrate-binding protein [Acidobacteriota bacterium]
MRLLGILLTAILLLGCSSTSSRNRLKLRVGVTPVPAGEVLAEVVPLLKAQGIEVELVSFTDYIQPNLALAAGDLDANLYQNVPFLEQFNRDRGTRFVAVRRIYLPPMGVYAGRAASFSQLSAQPVVAIPNDPTNLGRALLVLQAAGLIRLKPASGVAATVQDIIENPRHLQIRELEAAQIPRALPDVDIAVINANYALDAGLNPLRDALFYEKDVSGYANVLAVNAGQENDTRIQALAAALTSAPIRQFIQTRYKGAVVPIS